jgi:hypothetical protein
LSDGAHSVEWHVAQIPLLPVEPPPGTPNPDAFRVGQLAQYLFGSYFAHQAAILVARDPRAPGLLPPVAPGDLVPIGHVPSKASARGHAFHLPYYLEWAQMAPSDEFEQAFLSGAIIALGDALAAHRYFDHAPVLELVRHLRNGVAHGNRFNIRKAGIDQLSKWPAKLSDFEVTPALNGQPVLWAFMERGDVVSLFQAVSVYLIRLGNGDPLRP